jgi:hypothetical protein
MNFTLDTNKAQRELIAQLEQKNRYVFLSTFVDYDHDLSVTLWQV